ncbi:MAG: DHA2 family efflux MFS transporter permease subunit [Actinobacteria bacterium]|nr:DHA2 family efflux MFS transporter permease subunit [Actinomycetota bacterium]
MSGAGVSSQAEVRFESATGKWIIAAAVLGSGIAFLDSTVINVAIPAIREDLDTGLAGVQWTIDAYLLTLSALLLIGGSLGDLYGRRRMFVYGLVGFAVTSMLCAVAPNIAVLNLSRALQGMTAALLVPGSLAMISASFHPDDRGRAIGAWSGLSGVTTAVGPFLGGFLIDAVSWRMIFLINVPLAAIAVWVAVIHVPETRDEEGGRKPDVPGALAAAVALGGILYGFIEGPVVGWDSPSIYGSLALGSVAVVVFLVIEARSREPMLHLSLFRSRQFSGANAATLLIYAALSGAMFLVVIQLQSVLDYSPLEAGAALVPVTLLLLVMSARAGAIATRIGPRLPMTIGPLVAAIGLALLGRIEPGTSYATVALPGIVVFGIGLGITVAPLTTAVLAAAPSRYAGIASGVNNAVARTAGALAVAILPIAGGIAGAASDSPERFDAGFTRTMVVAAGLCAAGGLLSFVFIRKPGDPVISSPLTAGGEVPED